MVVDGLKGEQNNFVLDMVGDGEQQGPSCVLLQDGCDVLSGWSPCNGTSCRVLCKLYFMDGFLRVTLVKSGSDKTVDQNGSCARGKRRTEEVDFA